MATVEGIEDASDGVTAPEAVVLETKLTRPRVRSEHVPRRDLLAALRDSHRLTLVAAPPGFGKTTLLAEWAATEDGSALAWLSLDDDDNDRHQFLATLLKAGMPLVQSLDLLRQRVASSRRRRARHLVQLGALAVLDAWLA